MNDIRALIEQAREGHRPCQPPLGCHEPCGWCHACHRHYPCIPARLADALEAADDHQGCSWQWLAEQNRRLLAEALEKLAVAERRVNEMEEQIEQEASNSVATLLDMKDQRDAVVSDLAAAERRVAEIERKLADWEKLAAEKNWGYVHDQRYDELAARAARAEAERDEHLRTYVELNTAWLDLERRYAVLARDLEAANQRAERLTGALGNWECGTCGGPLRDPTWQYDGEAPCDFCVEARAALQGITESEFRAALAAVHAEIWDEGDETVALGRAVGEGEG